MVKFTKTQQRIVDVLKDGRPHKIDELLAAIDVQATENVLYVHICHINIKLRPLGQEIICKYNGRHQSSYIHVRLLHSSHDGRR